MINMTLLYRTHLWKRIRAPAWYNYVWGLFQMGSSCRFLFSDLEQNVGKTNKTFGPTVWGVIPTRSSWSQCLATLPQLLVSGNEGQRYRNSMEMIYHCCDLQK